MALGLLFKDVHGELLRLDIIRLSPLDKKGQELLILVLQSKDLRDKVSLSLQEDHILAFEIKGLQDSFLHGGIIRWVDSFSVVQKVLFEKHTCDLSDIGFFGAHVLDEQLEEGLWVLGSLRVELSLSSLSDSVVGTEDILEWVLGLHDLKF